MSLAEQSGKKTVIRNARLIDGTGAPETTADVVFEDGIIREVTPAGKHSHALRRASNVGPVAHTK